MMPPPSNIILRHAGVPAFLVTNTANIRYLTGIDCTDGLVFLTPRSVLLLVDGRYAEVAARESYEHVRIRNRDSLRSVLAHHRVIGLESSSVTLSEMAMFKRFSKNTKFVHTTGVIEQFRRSKRQDEIRLLKRADAITREMLRRVPSALTVGMRERELAWMLRSWAHELGAEDVSFDPIVAFGANTSHPHHAAGERRLRKRDIVLVDCGIRFHGYCGDRTEMYFLGEPTVMQARALDAVRHAKNAAISMVRAGASTQAIDAAARAVLRDYGMEDAFTHALGHGVGLDIHEGVSLSRRGQDWTLLRNEVITIEPGVYFPGAFGIRLEEMIVVNN